MNAIFGYGDNYVEFGDFFFSREEMERGNPYNGTFTLKVSADGFAGVSFCEFDMRELKRFVSDLGEMYEFRSQTTEFREIGYGGTLRFSVDHTGHVNVSGHIFGEAAINQLKFEFSADQTVLARFITGLRQFIDC